MATMTFLASFFLLVSFSLKSAAGIAAMSVDLGSESMKIAIVMPRRPMEIVLDGDSERKIPTAIAFRDNERYFGREALDMARRAPTMVFQGVTALLGKTPEHPSVKQFLERYPYHNITFDETAGLFIFNHPNGASFTTEELVAMLLERARTIAEDYAGTTLRSAVLTVPHYYTQAERRSLLRSAKMAGLDVLQLLNNNAAVALNFGVFRHSSFNETAQYFMFFDLGYSSTTATVVSYHVGKHHLDGVTSEGPILTVMGVGSASTVGTSSLIFELRDHLARQFQSANQHLKDNITENHRAMAKLTHEAGRVITVLSANTDVISQVDNLHQGIDFHYHMTRAEFETLCADTFNRLSKPFLEALESSKLELTAIQDIVLMGGGTRIPKVQSLLNELGQRSDLNKGVNSDEAAVLGAVYQAAFRTPGFKVVRFVLRDFNLYPIAVDFDRAPVVGDDGSMDSHDNSSPHIRRILFPRGNPFPQKRAITFNRHLDDLTFFVNYAEATQAQGALSAVANLSRITTTGVASAVQRHPSAEMRGVKAHFYLDPSGILLLTSVDCALQPTPDSVQPQGEQSAFQKLGDKISELFSGSSTGDSSSADSTGTGVEKQQGINETDLNNTQAHSGNNVNVTSEAPTNVTVDKTISTKQRTAVFTERVGFHVTHLDAPVPTDDNVKASIEKLRALRQSDQDRRDWEYAVNELESSLFTTRDKIQSEVYIQHSTAQEVSVLSKLITEYSEWYDLQDRSTAKEEFENRYNAIRENLLPIELRVTEAERRPKALTGLQDSLVKANNFLKLVKETMAKLPSAFEGDSLASNVSDASTSGNETKPASPFPWPPLFTDQEQQGLEALINKTESWLASVHVKLAASSPVERPPVLVSEIEEAQRKLEQDIKYLTNKMSKWQAEIQHLLRLHTAHPTPDNSFEPNGGSRQTPLTPEANASATDSSTSSAPSAEEAIKSDIARDEL